MTVRPSSPNGLSALPRAALICDPGEQKRQRMAAAGDIRPTKHPDYDNILKVLDALNRIDWRDYAQVVECDACATASARCCALPLPLPVAAACSTPAYPPETLGQACRRSQSLRGTMVWRVAAQAQARFRGPQ